MTPTETQKLAQEIKSNATPTPVWSNVEELVDMRHPITIDGRKRQLTFAKAVELYKALDAEIEQKEAIKRELKKAIEAAMLMSGEQQVACEDYKVTMITKSGTKKIVPEKLLELGVDAMVIAKATEVGKETTYAQITKNKE